MCNDGQIRKLCESNPPLIKDAPDFETQLQPAGFDVTVKSVARLSGSATIGKPYGNRVAHESPMAPIDGYYELVPGAYIVYINEYVSLPDSVSGLAVPRSTLFRCGASLSSGLWDPGFSGRGRLGLYVPNGIEILYVEDHAPIAQLIFFPTNPVEKGFQFNEFYREE
ncbi:dCTP deaminase domain-containing protein [Nocardia beijingensis]